MNVFGIGLPEMAVIFVVALLIFGPKKLPEVGRSLGKAIRGFQQASSEFQNEFQKEAVELQEAVKTTAELDTKQTAEPETKQIEAAKLEQDTVSSAQKS
ncbi:TatA/E family twin arginine-targeting protein translocase [Brasilonema bromeliae]|uniref:Sec-independent protein translocase protein TatA n=1 Tax=Brasilonema bromeliae SPC951 TaxID=385972 RepID=A0ABX1P901_9CYAN|nr:TatA/E family twin arginine-targeting protein translocase [Brasilonema bromeliae]NMG20826.1 TatA/E family twin arginine-targeting protein translocase [Brasilonema bromeliae SPC951]